MSPSGWIYLRDRGSRFSVPNIFPLSLLLSHCVLYSSSLTNFFTESLTMCGPSELVRGAYYDYYYYNQCMPLL